MIKKSIFLILMFQVVYSDLLQFYNFSRIPQYYQPLGSINSNHIFFRKTYKAYTIYQYEKIVNNNNNFGKFFTFSPINDLCKNDFEKSNAIYCLQKYPNASWWCIYDYCIRNTVTYIGFNEFIIKKEFELPFAY